MGGGGKQQKAGELRQPWPWHFYTWLNKDESLRHLHSESFRHLRAVSGNMNELSVIQFLTYFLDWIILGLSLKKKKKNPPPKQPKHPDPVHVSVIICIKAAASLRQKVFSWISSFSDLICPLLQLVLAPCGGTCYAKREILSDIAGNQNGPASESLPDPLMLSQGQDSFLVRRKLLIDPFFWWRLTPVSSGQKHTQLSGSFWSDKRLLGLKFSLNGLPGDPVAEPPWGASSPAPLISPPLGSLDRSPASSRQGPQNGSRKSQIVCFLRSRIFKHSLVTSSDPRSVARINVESVYVSANHGYVKTLHCFMFL